MKIVINPRAENRFAHLKEKSAQAEIATIGHYTEYGFMAPGIHLMNPREGGQVKIAGPALTVQIPANESKAMHLAVSMAQEGDVVVVDRCLDVSHAAVGEMVALCASVRKAAAIIIDGPVTDIAAIREIGIPVFARGLTALTTKFIKDTGVINGDISCGGVVVHPGDLVMADENGVLVLSDPAEAEELLDKAVADQAYEAADQESVKNGATLQQMYVPEYPV